MNLPDLVRFRSEQDSVTPRGGAAGYWIRKGADTNQKRRGPRHAHRTIRTRSFADMQNVYNHRSVINYEWNQKTRELTEEQLAFLPVVGINRLS